MAISEEGRVNVLRSSRYSGLESRLQFALYPYAKSPTVFYDYAEQSPRSLHAKVTGGEDFRKGNRKERLVEFTAVTR